MTEDTHFYQPAHGHGLAHDPFNALVAPRPIGWISSRDRNGALNLAPYSFFNAFNYHPPIVAFSSIGYKDSVRNAEETGEFCWNLVTTDLSKAMNETCAAVAPEVDEFALSGLTPKPSRIISAPHVAESPVAMECRVSQVLRLTGADGEPVDTWMVFGEVVGVHIAQHLIRDGVYDTAAAGPVMRGGGPADYFTVGPDQKFRMHRPG